MDKIKQLKRSEINQGHLIGKTPFNTEKRDLIWHDAVAVPVSRYITKTKA